MKWFIICEYQIASSLSGDNGGQSVVLTTNLYLVSGSRMRGDLPGRPRTHLMTRCLDIRLFSLLSSGLWHRIVLLVVTNVSEGYTICVFCPENFGDTFLRNVCNHLLDCNQPEYHNLNSHRRENPQIRGISYISSLVNVPLHQITCHYAAGGRGATSEGEVVTFLLNVMYEMILTMTIIIIPCQQAGRPELARFLKPFMQCCHLAIALSSDNEDKIAVSSGPPANITRPTPTV
jgi:hypothetical protein